MSKKLAKSLLLTSCMATLSLGGLSQSVVADDDTYFEFSGFVAADLRVFPNDAIQTGQEDQTLNSSIVLQPEMLYEWNDGDDRIEFNPFARLDSHDDERSHWDIRELNYLHINDGWDVVVGADKVFWGVTESRHLVDIINQTDAVEDVDGEDKLGQPMINLGVQQDWGNINAFVLPYFRERTFAGVDGRLRGSLVVDTDQAVYESSREEKHVDYALRYSHVVGDWDLGAAYFRGTSRDPRLVAGTDGSGNTVLIPHYDLIDRASIDVQATIEEWLWKLEAIYENADNYDSFAAMTAGFEYSFFGAIDDVGDIGILLEYHYDGRNDLAPATMFDDDIFVGTRLTLNDEDDTSFLGGVIYDPSSKATSFSVEAETRLSDFWSIELEGRMYQNIGKEELLYSSRDDDHIQLRLTRYF
ncbi:hypothetical protein [Curvivirga aplysinae]|uniref:hypothetical protein n=1 Tax=Curvivirga aplysinae TaxID=2529852 RepID=UPI001C3F82FA|nr:hypothetical protein [Curvivirga aplysinae]